MNTLKSFVLAVSVSSLLAGCASLPSWLGGTQTPAPAPAQESTPGPEPSAPPSYAAPAHEHAMPHQLGTKGMKSLQHALAAKGYYQGKVDGRNGPQTKAAVSRYQQDLGATPTGDVDDQTWSSLGLSEGN